MLYTCNKLLTRSVYNLPINLFVLVYWEKNICQLEKYKKLHNFVSISNKLVIIQLLYGSTKFRNILI